MYYVELTEAYEVVERIDSITGVRQFHDDGPQTSTLTLPIVGDRFSTDVDSIYYSLFAIERRCKKFGGHPNKHIWTINYSSNPSQNPQKGLVAPENLPTSASIGGEFISISSSAAGIAWKSGAKIEQTIPVRVGTGAFTLTKRVALLKLLDYAKYAGLVNSTEMKLSAGNIFPTTTVLFEGAKATEYWNEKGKRRWKVDFSFSTKYIETERLASNHSIEIGGWMFLFNETTRLFEETNPPLYDTGELNDLLDIPEAP